MNKENMHLLVVEDEDSLREIIPEIVPPNWLVTSVSTPRSVPYEGVFEAALVDLHLSGPSTADGLKVIEKLSRKGNMEVIAMSGDLNRELMEASLKAGATRFLAKPLSEEELCLVLEKIESWNLLQQATWRSQLDEKPWIGSSQQSQNIKRQIANLSGEKSTILLEGESGTGKEVVARLLHKQLGNAPFIPVNIAAVPKQLFESELFGHMRGSFTGADQNKMGLAEAAHKGTLFIDEIEALPMDLQVKLLRFLETGEVKRVGAKETTIVDTRVIVATNRNLDEMVKNGEFREDLLWRIRANSVSLPPLRDRKEDVAELARYFISFDRIRNKSICEEALKKLTEHDWPGNVRELKRFCENLVVLSPLPIIRREDVESELKTKNISFGNQPGLEKVDFRTGLQQLLHQYEAQLIEKSLENYKDIDETAKVLKISRSNLYKKIKDFDIDWRN